MVIDVSTPLTLGGVALAILAALIGFIGHELVHVGVLSAFGRPPALRFDLSGLLFAAVPPAGTPRWQNAIALLAPIPWAVAGTWALFDGGLVSVPLSLDAALLLAAFLIAALPSPGDWYVLLLYRPEQVQPEVALDG